MYVIQLTLTQCKSQNTCTKYSYSLLSFNQTAHTSYCWDSNENVCDCNTGQMKTAVSIANNWTSMDTDNALCFGTEYNTCTIV